MQFLVISCLYVLIPMLSSKSDHRPSEEDPSCCRIRATSGPKCPDPSDSLWCPLWGPPRPPLVLPRLRRAQTKVCISSARSSSSEVLQ